MVHLGEKPLIPFSSENQRHITFLNAQYKWFTFCLLLPMDFYLDKHGLLESAQEGVRTKCSKTMDNQLIDKVVWQGRWSAKRSVEALLGSL